MITPIESARSWRVLWLIPVALLAVMSIIATGGGGGDDGFDSGNPDLPPNILPSYNFFLANLQDDTGLTVSVGNLFTVSVGFDAIFDGSVNLDVDANNNVSFLSYSARPGARLDLTVSSLNASPLDGSFAVIVTEEINSAIDAVPGGGAFNVVTPAETVAVTIVNGGVELSLNGGEAVVYNTWDEFTNLVDDDTQETWQRRAAFAANGLDFVVGLFFQMADVLDELESVTLSNPLVATCDMFTGSPPDFVLPQGDTTLTWLGSGELSPGDNFDWQFNQCWSADTNELLSGGISLENYAETVDFSNNTLFEIGFGSLGGQPGGVVFDLTISETVEDFGVFTILPDNEVGVTGGFVMIIQAP